MTIVGAIAEFESQLILESQRVDICAAKPAGKYKARKPTTRENAAYIRGERIIGAKGLAPHKPQREEDRRPVSLNLKVRNIADSRRYARLSRAPSREGLRGEPRSGAPAQSTMPVSRQ